MTLDDKLRYLLKQPNTTVAQIKQAFIDEGWADTNNLTTLANWAAKDRGLMTGQEFYDRFEKEYEHQVKENDSRTGGELSHQRHYIIEAAKKAAGIK